MDKIALQKASSVFEYFYNEALSEFGPKNAQRLAQIPADYVYNELIASGGNCYINEKCCLKYCNEVLDRDFDKFDPELKKLVYEKASGVSVGNVSEREINNKLRSYRRKGNVNKIYNDSLQRFRTQREFDLSELMGALNLNAGAGNDLVDLMGSVNLNRRNAPTTMDLDFSSLNLNEGDMRTRMDLESANLNKRKSSKPSDLKFKKIKLQ